MSIAQEINQDAYHPKPSRQGPSRHPAAPARPGLRPGGRPGTHPGYRRHRLDADLHGARAVHDHPRAGALLRRPGPLQERPVRPHAVLRHHRPGDRPLEPLRLQPGLLPPGMEKGAINLNSFIGGLDKAFFAGLTRDSLTLTIPESVFATFQMTFAIITPALIVGAFAERMKFSALLWFMGIWFTVVYAPIAHMVWSGDGGLMCDWGVLDFAGGTVVHINAGVAGLVAALVLGKREGLPDHRHAPPQPDLHGDRRLHAVGRLVRLQRRQRRGGRRQRRHGHAGHPDRHRHRGPGLDVRGVDGPR